MDRDPILARSGGRAGGISRRAALVRVGGGGLAVAAVATGAGHALAAVQTPSADQLNEQVVRRFFDEVLSQKKLAVVDEIVAATFVDDDAGGKTGRDDLKKGLAAGFATFPDQKSTVLDLIVKGNAVWVRSTLTGTNTGALDARVGATGKKVTIVNVDLFRIDEAGKIAERFTLYDNAGLLLQLGFQLVPPASS